ncbi:MAG: DNA repair protein RadA [bacterium]|nr:DNA repair protein RadA [bacterium]
MYICSNCGYGSASWIGKCPDCQSWNTLVAQKESMGTNKKSKEKFSVSTLSHIPSLKKERKKTGIYELDRVLGGGIVPGGVVLLTGEPGVGKSTLLLQALKSLKTLYISGEETGEQVKERAERLGIDLNHFYFSESMQIESIIDGIEDLKDKVDIVVVDSIQTVYSANLDSQIGTVSQLRESTTALISTAKRLKMPVLIIGHVTKDGDIAGPKTMEHMVDVVLSFEGEKVSHYRILRSQKNRFGPTDEIGIFEMQQGGLIEVNNPAIFLEENLENTPGKSTVGIIEGKRPLFFEIQTLASPTVLSMPRRVVKGVDYNKVLLLLAVIRKHLGIPLDSFDIYVNVIGGVDIRSTAADLGIIASLVSSIKNIPLPDKSLFIGEVGLLGEVRKIFGEQKIIAEAKRLSFKTIYSSHTIQSIKELRQIIRE